MISCQFAQTRKGFRGALVLMRSILDQASVINSPYVWICVSRRRPGTMFVHCTHDPRKPKNAVCAY